MPLFKNIVTPWAWFEDFLWAFLFMFLGGLDLKKLGSWWVVSRLVKFSIARMLPNF